MQGSQREGHHRGTLEGDYFGLREWRTGDSQRWIHWRTSAKLGKLAVRQFEQQRRRDINLLLDLWEPTGATDQQRETTELAVSFLASAVMDLSRKGGNRLVVSVVGRETKLWCGAASGLFGEEILDHLAVAAPGDGFGIGEALERLATRAVAGARTTVISTRARPYLKLDGGGSSEPRSSPSEGGGSELTWIDCRGDQLGQYFRFAS
jgi:uncharacterized protein (DUF58 family)